MEKQYFKKIAKTEFEGKTLDIVNKQIDDFYNISNQTFNNQNQQGNF